MNCATLPLNQINAINAFSNMSTEPVGKWFKALTLVYALPKIAESVAQSFPNERIRRMTQEDAIEFYLPLAATHRILMDLIERVETRFPRLSSTLLRWWINRMTVHAERIGDVSEALAWSAEDGLRKKLADAVSHVEQSELHLTQ
jgi:hypothetical protein